MEAYPIFILKIGGVRNSTVAPQPCPLGHITADKMLRYASRKLSLATSFICKTLGLIADLPFNMSGLKT